MIKYVSVIFYETTKQRNSKTLSLGWGLVNRKHKTRIWVQDLSRQDFFSFNINNEEEKLVGFIYISRCIILNRKTETKTLLKTQDIARIYKPLDNLSRILNPGIVIINCD